MFRIRASLVIPFMMSLPKKKRLLTDFFTKTSVSASASSTSAGSNGALDNCENETNSLKTLSMAIDYDRIDDNETQIDNDETAHSNDVHTKEQLKRKVVHKFRESWLVK